MIKSREQLVKDFIHTVNEINDINQRIEIANEYELKRCLMHKKKNLLKLQRETFKLLKQFYPSKYS